MINNRSDNCCLRKINLYKKEIKLRENYIMFFYLLGCSSLFLFSDIIQKSKLTSNYQQQKYERCIVVLTRFSHLLPEDIDQVCQDFHHITNFNKFIQNLVFTWFIFYGLMREIIGKFIFPFWYWVVGHLAILIFSLLGEVKELQFSIDTDAHLDTTQVAVIVSVGISFVFLISRQIYTRSIRYILLLKIILLNFFIYSFFLATKKAITYHLHHVFLCGILSFCFNDFQSKFSLFCHAIMIGIMIQGINFFNIFGIIIFSTNNLVNYPDLGFSIIAFVIILLFSLLIGLLYKFWCVEEIELEEEDHLELPLL